MIETLSLRMTIIYTWNSTFIYMQRDASDRIIVLDLQDNEKCGWSLNNPTCIRSNYVGVKSFCLLADLVVLLSLLCTLLMQLP